MAGTITQCVCVGECHGWYYNTVCMCGGVGECMAGTITQCVCVGEWGSAMAGTITQCVCEGEWGSGWY